MNSARATRSLASSSFLLMNAWKVPGWKIAYQTVSPMFVHDMVMRRDFGTPMSLWFCQQRTK